MTKELFINSVKAIEDFHKLEDTLYNLGIDLIESEVLSNMEHQLVANLSNACKLDCNEFYGDDLCFFIYELNFGKDYKPGFINEEDGTEIDFSSAEKVWEYFVKQHPEIEDK